MGSERGQASAELIAIVPLLLVSGMALVQALIGCWALLSAGEAARAAARIVHVGGNAEVAAEAALPSLLKPAEVEIDGSKVRIEIRAPVLFPGIPDIPVAASSALDPAAGA